MMILIDSVMLALLSVVCAVELTVFSHRFRTVLTTLGAINQVRVLLLLLLLLLPPPLRLLRLLLLLQLHPRPPL